MKINIAKSSGFCFGVRRAINISKKVAASEKNVYVLGDIVHNTFVVKDLKKLGIKKIKNIVPSSNATLIVRAHGAPQKIFSKAKKCGYKIVDATCPKVKEIYKIARDLEKNNKIIIIGDNNHDEVKGIVGQLNKKPLILESPSKVLKKDLSGLTKAAVITQSTQSIDNINTIMYKLKSIVPNVKLYNTTCKTTTIKQKEIQDIPLKNDLVLIIGSKHSANTKRLYMISKKINKKTRWIECSKDLKSSWFKDIKNVGIMAGASTPDYVTKEIVKEINRLSDHIRHCETRGKRASRRNLKKAKLTCIY
ncbi:MAG: 4-hydroxy-3-methylbut-2-enyl diphosphate reductase [Candidatus Omnitrophota bacterium]